MAFKRSAVRFRYAPQNTLTISYLRFLRTKLRTISAILGRFSFALCRSTLYSFLAKNGLQSKKPEGFISAYIFYTFTQAAQGSARRICRRSFGVPGR